MDNDQSSNNQTALRDRADQKQCVKNAYLNYRRQCSCRGHFVPHENSCVPRGTVPKLGKVELSDITNCPENYIIRNGRHLCRLLF